MINALIDYYFIKLLFVVHWLPLLLLVLPIKHHHFKMAKFSKTVSKKTHFAIHMRMRARICLSLFIYITSDSMLLTLDFRKIGDGISQKVKVGIGSAVQRAVKDDVV